LVIRRGGWPDPAPGDVAHIAADLRPLAVPVDLLTPLPGNPHQGDVGMVGLSVGKFSQRKPVVVNAATGVIEAGNTTWRAVVAGGHRWIAAVLVEDDPTTEKAFAVADNRASTLGWDDPGLLLAFLDDIGPDLWEPVGFDGDDVDVLRADADRAALSFGDGLVGFEVGCPQCGHRFRA
jgi:hypothetical protein